MGMEIRFLDWLQSLRTPVADQLMCFITKLGDGGQIWLCLAVILLLFSKTRKSGVILTMALFVDTFLCNGLLKKLFGRIRPFDVNTSVELLIARPRSFSFPSGHTAASFAAASALYFAGEKKLWKPAFLLAVMIAFSRMYLYVHYPTDVLGGIVVGIGAGYFSYLAVGKLFTDDNICLADMITFVRMVFSVPLLFSPVFSLRFYLLYILCGLTDMADGYIARKTNTANAAGAKLDSIADAVFFTVCLINLVPAMDIPKWLWIWIVVIAMIRVVNVLSGYICQHQLVMLHTPANKVTGFMLFLFPLLLQSPGMYICYAAIAICMVATFAAVQEGHMIRIYMRNKQHRNEG